MNRVEYEGKQKVLRVVKLPFGDISEYLGVIVGEEMTMSLKDHSDLFSVSEWGYVKDHHIFVRVLLISETGIANLPKKGCLLDSVALSSSSPMMKEMICVVG